MTNEQLKEGFIIDPKVRFNMPDPPENEENERNDYLEEPEEKPIDDRWAPDYMDER